MTADWGGPKGFSSGKQAQKHAAVGYRLIEGR